MRVWRKGGDAITSVSQDVVEFQVYSTFRSCSFVKGVRFSKRGFAGRQLFRISVMDTTGLGLGSVDIAWQNNLETAKIAESIVLDFLREGEENVYIGGQWKVAGEVQE